MQDFIALVADIENTIHQMRVESSHLKALCFLWWCNSDLDKISQVFQMMVRIFEATSSLACPSFCLKQTTINFEHLFDPKIAKIV